MVEGIFSSKHGSQGKTLAAVGVVGDTYAVGLSVITNSMDARYFVMADAFHKQLVGTMLIGAFDTAVIPMHRAFFPYGFTVEAVNDFFGKGDSCALRGIKFMYMVGFG